MVHVIRHVQAETKNGTDGYMTTIYGKYWIIYHFVTVGRFQHAGIQVIFTSFDGERVKQIKDEGGVVVGNLYLLLEEF